MTPVLPLRALRQRATSEFDWRKAMAAHGPDLDAPLSLGDIARSNGALDALWCIRVLDWSDVALRRAVIGGAVLPYMRRTVTRFTDQRVQDAVWALTCWAAAADVDLYTAAERPAEDAAREAKITRWHDWNIAHDAQLAAWAGGRCASSDDASDALMEVAIDMKRRAALADIVAAFPPIRATEPPNKDAPS